MLKLKGSGTENMLIFGTGTFSLYAQEFMLLSMQDPLEPREGTYFWLESKSRQKIKTAKGLLSHKGLPCKSGRSTGCNLLPYFVPTFPASAKS